MKSKLMSFAWLATLAWVTALPAQSVKLEIDGLRCHDFCVEPLTKKEVADLAEAKRQLDEAQQKYDSVVATIKALHGETVGHHAMGGTVCLPYDSVDFFGGYALITYHYQSCVAW